MSRTLKPEDRISHYRVVGPLGAGGMGEVYCAQDQTLERDVALKILPPELVQSEERVRRFVLEAKSASSLNHPNIVTIYEIGEDRVRAGDGPAIPDSSPLHYISMELVSGKTLAAKIHEEKADLKALLGWLAQAAEGVAKAHAAGIVHRDLKPGNIMVSSDGYTKVLDFGLAKLTERTSNDAGLSAAATMTASEHTSEGAVVGTAGYMAPEQVRGQAVDARADVFAFGCMLYEAATRKRPFAADSKVETMHRILHDMPAPIEKLNPEAPPELRRLIRRCLAKDPNQRPQSMRDLALELREIVDEYDSLSASASSDTKAPALRRTHRRAITAAILGVTAIGVLASLFLPKKPRPLAPNLRTRILDVPMSGIHYPGLSGDGRWIALPARDEQGVWGLYYMNANGGQVRPVAVDSSVGVNYADISPDGSQIAYGVGSTLVREEVRVVPALGGQVRTVARPGEGPRWSADGQRIGYVVSSPTSGRTEYWSVLSDGSGRERLAVDTTNTSDGRWSFCWSPNSKQIAFLRNFAGSSYNEIIVRDLASGRERQITHDRKVIDEIVWTRDNEILFSSNRGGPSNIWVMRAGGGAPLQVTRGAGPDVGIKISADGKRLLYLTEQRLAAVGWLDTQTGRRGLVTRADEPIQALRPSPDGRFIAAGINDGDPLSRWTLAVIARDGSERRTVVSAEDDPRAWDWSPDGRQIGWVSDKKTRPDSLTLRILDVVSGEKLPPVSVAARGSPVMMRWIASDTLSVQDNLGSFSYCLSSMESFDRAPDSTIRAAIRIPGRVFQDFRAGGGVYQQDPSGEGARLVLPVSWFPGCWPTGNVSFGYCWPESLGLCRLHLPSGRLEPLRMAAGLGNRANLNLDCTRDGRFIFWRETRLTSKLVMIEGMHQ